MLYRDLIDHYIGKELTKITKQKCRPMFSECEFLKIVVRFSLRVCASYLDYNLGLMFIIRMCKTLVSREDFPKMFQQFIDWKKMDKDQDDD